MQIHGIKIDNTKIYPVQKYEHETDTYTVTVNRTTDASSAIDQKVTFANDNSVDAVIEGHLNSNAGTLDTGVEAYHGVKDADGKALALAIHNQIAALGFRGWGIKTRLNADGKAYFGIAQRAHTPAVFVGMAFINNPADVKPFDVRKMAQAIAGGILEMFPVPAKEQPSKAEASAPLYRVFKQIGTFSSIDSARAFAKGCSIKTIILAE